MEQTNYKINEVLRRARTIPGFSIKSLEGDLESLPHEGMIIVNVSSTIPSDVFKEALANIPINCSSPDEATEITQRIFLDYVGRHIGEIPGVNLFSKNTARLGGEFIPNYPSSIVYNEKCPDYIYNNALHKNFSKSIMLRFQNLELPSNVEDLWTERVKTK